LPLSDLKIQAENRNKGISRPFTIPSEHCFKVSRPSFFSRGFSFAAIHHLLVKRINDPSYLTVMLNMMDDDDGFFLTLPLRGNLIITDEHLRSRPAPHDVGTFVAFYSSWSLSHVRESPAVGWPQNSERSSI
jgi:hypothetical protein